MISFLKQWFQNVGFYHFDSEVWNLISDKNYIFMFKIKLSVFRVPSMDKIGACFLHDVGQLTDKHQINKNPLNISYIRRKNEEVKARSKTKKR